MRLEDLMERAAQYDETLARDIKDYVHGRKYGLVYEASKPEFVRMWKKPVVRGDLVNILPPRGVMEDTKSDDDSSEVAYKVMEISNGKATLRNEQTDETVETAVDDIVALARFDKPIYAGPKETDRIERGGDKPYHVVINGENYHALQTLIYAYQGQVDCIYIDPPYNTGAKDWKYNNNYIGKDDIYRHSKWLTFMEDRLKLAKKLLNPRDSVLIITIDEKEYLRLGLLLEQMFPEAHIQMVSSAINSKGVARDEFFRVNEYLYIIRFGVCLAAQLDLPEEWRGNIRESTTKKVRWGSLMRSGTGASRLDSPGCFYPIFISADKKHFCGAGDALPIHADRHSVVVPEGQIAIFPIHDDGTEGRWQYSRDKFLEIQKKGYVRISTQTSKEATLRYISEGWQKKVENGQIPVVGKAEDGSLIFDDDDYVQEYIPCNQWWIPSHNATEFGSKLLKNIIGNRTFPFPKSLYAVHDVISFFVAKKPNALIVDFFAGSGTTLHAVNLLNAEDGGRRRSIIVTNNEVSDAESKILTEQGHRQGDNCWEKLGIARYVTWPRTICSIEGNDINGNALKGNYFRSDISMADGFEENAIFFDIEYLEPSVVSADLAFDRIAPILWLCGGCEGEILQRHKGYVVGDTYAVLFDPRYKRRFVDVVTGNKHINTIFIVTDAAERYRSLCAELPGRRVLQLYESYLRSFEINAIG